MRISTRPGAVWPGAAGATLAMGIVDYAFPLYLTHVRTLRIGTSFVFILIVLVWFYVLALILLAGAVVNELRAESAARAATGADRGPIPSSRPGPHAPR